MVKRAIEVSIIGKDKLSSALDSITKGALRRIGEELTMFAKRLPAAAVEMVKLGATAERQKHALDNLAASFGQSGDEIVASIQRASDMTIDRMTAMQAANKAMLLGVAKTPKEFERITRTAVALGRAMGQDAAKSIDDFVVAAGRQSIMIADNLGLIIRQKDLQDDVNRILKENPGITDAAAKSQAFLNAMLTSGETKMEALGTQTEGTATKLERLTASFSDLKVAAAEAIIETGFFGDVLLDIDWRTAQLELTRTQKRMVELGIITEEQAENHRKAAQSLTGLIATTEEQAEQIKFIRGLLADYNLLLGISNEKQEAVTKSATDWLNSLEDATPFLRSQTEAQREQTSALSATRAEMLAFTEGLEEATDHTFLLSQQWAGLVSTMGTEDPFAAPRAGLVLFGNVLSTTQVNTEDAAALFEEMTRETQRLADETIRLAEEAEAAAAVTGDEFVQAVGDAEDGTVNWAIALLEAADAAGADANELAILAGSLGIYTDEQIAAALATVALTTTIDTLGQAIADGSITIDEAISVVQEAVDALKIDISLTRRSTAATGRSTTATRQNTKAKRDAVRAARELAREQARSGDLFIDAIGNMEIATEAADAWAVKLLEAADAAGADATELALLAGALGLYTDEQLQAALAMAAMEAAIADLGAKIAAGMKIDKAIREFNKLREALQLPAWMQPGSPTPLELGLLGIADAMRQVSAVELPRFQSSLAGAGAPGGNRMVTNNFMLTTNTQAAASMVRQDFQTMQAMAG